MHATKQSGVRLPERISEPKPIVFVVDDDSAVRGSLEPLIALEGWQPEMFASAEEFLARPPVAVPNCVVLDVGLPDISGLEVQRLLAHRLDMPIIFVAGYANAPTIVHAMKAGAVEFLSKPIAFDALLSAIRPALAHSRAVLDHQADIMPLRERYASLSRRECEVMRLIVSGQLNKQVGASLGITEITVKAHRGKVMRKMQAASLAALVTMAAKLGMLDVTASGHGRLEHVPPSEGTHSMRTIAGSKILVTGALLLALGSAGAATDEQAAASIVRYDDLNLSVPAGMRTLKGRIKAAADRVCIGATTSDRYRSTTAHDRCMREATERALAQVNPQVSM